MGSNQNLVQNKMYKEALRDGSINRILMQASEHDLDPWHPNKKAGMVVCTCSPNTGGADSWMPGLSGLPVQPKQ